MYEKSFTCNALVPYKSNYMIIRSKRTRNFKEHELHFLPYVNRRDKGLKHCVGRGQYVSVPLRLQFYSSLHIG